MHLKDIVKSILCTLLEWQVRWLRRKYPFKVVAVVGSVGKTSTKFAIAHTLSQSLRVQYQEGNYNDRLTVPLVLFGHTLPRLTDFSAWVRILRANQQIIRQGFPYDVAVLELGTDGPGQIKKFAYLRPEIAVVTAITPEHMEFFKTIEAVAAEEFAVAKFATTILVNADDTPAQYIEGKQFKCYGFAPDATYHIVEAVMNGLEGLRLQVDMNSTPLQLQSPTLGMAGAKIAVAAAAVASELHLSAETIQHSIQNLPPVSGRMQILRGLNGSTILDDTYNSTPVAVKAGLDVLASVPAEVRIAVLGSMNELGDYSRQAHEEVGEYCDPTVLSEVITIGEQARDFLAPKAMAAGCKVTSFLSPYGAGMYLKVKVAQGTVVLAKGSQNGVFAEEAIKQILENPSDAARLVRQSPEWLTKKALMFPEDNH
jgi:UDP-N-acetylmuramoyl-tripeptide--D-alanyl-D-alanine ligase